MTTKTPFLLNCWYVAAWSDELAPGQLLARKLLDEDVVMWRDAAGRVQAVLDQCPHRFAPLSIGRVMDDGSLQCGYHGLQFRGDGACSLNPHGNGAIPQAARVKSFPVVERHTAVWIWMGNPELADPERIVDFSILSRTPREGHKTVHGHFVVGASYLLEIDNLMDLTHPEYVHASSIGSAGHHSAQYEAFQEGDTRVHSNRWYLEGPCPPALDMQFPTHGRPVEHWVNMRWDAPSLLLLNVGVTFTGQRREDGLSDWSCQLLTPESATSTHYFFTHTRTRAVDSEAFDTLLMQQILHAFVNEDKPLLERIQRKMGDADLLTLKPVMLEGDAGAVRARRLLQKLIAQEQAQQEGAA